MFTLLAVADVLEVLVLMYSAALVCPHTEAGALLRSQTRGPVRTLAQSVISHFACVAVTLQSDRPVGL